MRNIFKGSLLVGMTAIGLTACADGVGPTPREVDVPAPVAAQTRKEAVNENAQSILYLPLGQDVLMPQSESGQPLPSNIVGPFELRGETLGGALQLILDGTNIPVAFETDSALTQTITVTSLKGPMDVVVKEVCSLANMYCSFQNGILVVKDREIFTITVPPIGAAADATTLLQNISTAVGSITGETPVTDASTRTIVYRATQRTSELARRYFQRLRTNTALVVFETYVWEVSLNAGNSTGIRWSAFDQIGRLRFGINLSGAADTNVGTPVSIGLPTASAGLNFATSDVFQFIAGYGTVKTISQPQITVLSGSSATLRVSDRQNYVASLSRTTTDGGTTTVSTTTDSVDSGFTLTIGSSWDNATVYSNINILLQELRDIETFDENPDAVVQLPKTTERELRTQVRGRPGDTLLIAGLVREQDSMDKEGPGFKQPLIPTSRSAQTSNSELVFLLKPRVIVFTAPNEDSPRRGTPVAPTDISAIVPEMAPESLPIVPMTVPPVPNAWEERAIAAPTQEAAPMAVPAQEAAPVGEPDHEAHHIPELESAPVTETVPQDSAVEIQPLPEVVPQSYKADAAPANQEADVAAPPVSSPSVIVNYDVLGR